jgi:hypothetical protein
MTLDENICAFYLEKLKTAEKPGMVLSEFFCRLFEVGFNSKLLVMLSKLLRLYGREAVFIAICDMYGVNDVTLDNPYPLLNYFIKKNMEGKTNMENYINTSSIEKEITRLSKKHLKFNDPFEEYPREFENKDDVFGDNSGDQ